MIRVSVHLLSAVTGRTTELARMDIANDGVESLVNDRRGAYVARTYVGRSSEALDRGTVSKRASLGHWPRHDLHVWNLVRYLLQAMGYDQTRPSVKLLDQGEMEPVLVGWRSRGWPAGPPPAYIEGPKPPEALDRWEPVFAFRPVSQ